MHRWAVQALAIVLDDDLPIGGHLARRGACNAEVAGAKALKCARVVVVGGDVVLERAGLSPEIDKQRALPLGNGHAVKPVLGAVNLVGTHVRRANQLAIESVGPGVVRTLDCALQRAGTGIAQQRAAMAADVVKGTQFAIMVTHDNDVLSGDVGCVVRAGLRDVLGPTNAGPRASEDAVDLALERGLRAVRVGGKRDVGTAHGSSVAPS